MSEVKLELPERYAALMRAHEAAHRAFVQQKTREVLRGLGSLLGVLTQLENGQINHEAARGKQDAQRLIAAGKAQATLNVDPS